jgi:uncharacterized damage-inducible protein DinB
MDAHDLGDMFDYNAWANQAVLGACEALSQEQFTQDMKSSFPSVRDTLVHILSGELIWLGRLTGGPAAGFLNPADFPDCESITKALAETDAALAKFAAALTPAALDTEIHYKTTAGTPFQGKPGQMLQHLANHSTYHRGQVTTMLRQLEAKAANSDMIRYRRELEAKVQA